MTNKEELNALKNEVETLNKKLAELNEEELKQVTGGNLFNEYCPNCGTKLVKEPNEHSQTIFCYVCPKCGYKEKH